MKNKSLVTYLSKGYLLARQSPDVFLVTFAVPYLLDILLLKTPLGQSLLLLLLTLSLIISIYFSTPALLQLKARTPSISLKVYIKIIARSLRRLVLPTILFIIIIGIGAAIIAEFINLSASEFANLLNQYGILAVILTLGLFSFTAYFFTLKNEGIFLSLWHSLVASLKNLPYVLPVLLIKTIPLLLIKTPTENILVTGAIYLFNTCVLFWLAASSLIYFRDRIE